MIETKDITKMVKHIVRRDKGLVDPQIMHPVREWTTGLGVVLVGVLLGSWFCFYLYNFYSTQLNIAIVVEEVQVPYQDTLVKKALLLYREEKKTYENILSGSNKEAIVTQSSIMSSSTTATSDSKMFDTATATQSTAN